MKRKMSALPYAARFASCADGSKHSSKTWTLPKQLPAMRAQSDSSLTFSKTPRDG